MQSDGNKARSAKCATSIVVLGGDGIWKIPVVGITHASSRCTTYHPREKRRSRQSVDRLLAEKLGPQSTGWRAPRMMRRSGGEQARKIGRLEI